MPRYVAFLRGVSPLNAKMPALKACFEAAGFADVRTLLSSGNVVFSNARASSSAALQRRAEAAMQDRLGHAFVTIVRPSACLRDLIASEPFAPYALAPSAKRVVTFLRHPTPLALDLPIERDGASILRFDGAEALCAYVPSPKGPAFMALLERTFGKDITTRTWDTVRKCAAA